MGEPHAPRQFGRGAITVKDVARRAKVSPGTVSNVLTGKRAVAPTTRVRVEKAIEELGYSPNMLARSLVVRRTHTLGVVTFGLSYYGPARILEGIEQRADDLAYSLLLSLLHHPDEPIEHALHALTARRVDGLVWAVPEIGNNRSWLCPEILERLPPTVFLSMKPRPNMYVVAVDNRAGGELAVQHLIAQGRRKIGLITGPLTWWEARERQAGWRRALRGAGLNASDSLVCEGDWSPRSGEQGMRHLLRRRPDIDGVFVSNDQMALGALPVAREFGRSVPEDLAIVGFDDIPEAEFFTPSLTTISHPIREIGSIAAQRVHDIIEDMMQWPRSRDSEGVTFVRPELVVRDSSVKR